VGTADGSACAGGGLDRVERRRTHPERDGLDDGADAERALEADGGVDSAQREQRVHHRHSRRHGEHHAEPIARQLQPAGIPRRHRPEGLDVVEGELDDAGGGAQGDEKRQWREAQQRPQACALLHAPTAVFAGGCALDVVRARSCAGGLLRLL
jgi:hypothetical protein